MRRRADSLRTSQAVSMDRVSLIVAAALFVIVNGCASGPHLLLGEPPERTDVATVIDQNPLRPGENIRTTALSGGASLRVWPGCSTASPAIRFHSAMLRERSP